MGKHIFKRTFVLTILALITTGLFAQPPKREVRATWLSTVWALDWPSVTVPAATGANEAAREAARNTQKLGLTTILDRLQANNFNTVFFQVRGMCDAFYRSQYEPWSQWLSSPLGSDPGWDPLAYILEEAHKRGIEVHAWLNPYRYSTASTSHSGLPIDYEVTHPEWLLDYGAYVKILNPGMPEVRQQICNVVADIVTNYDVDGIVFDDYFYIQGGGFTGDNEQYQQYNPNGLSVGDWRRENVNQMVRDVQARINSIKPYVTFGISPAGVAASNPSVAAKYGVEPSPGSDWQYEGIYSDPLAWLKDGSIDYISPQIYWSGTTFANLSPWWSKVANKFGRHFYSSNTSTFTTTELVTEAQINRDADLNGTTGSVYFRTNNMPTANFTALKTNSYQNKALRSAFGWKTRSDQMLVTDLALASQTLTWNYSVDNTVRYSVYAIPKANRNDADAFTSSKYLQGISYTKSFTLPAGVTSSTHTIAVAVYDRYGYESAPAVLGESSAFVAAPVLIYPADGAQDVALPALFTWQPSEGVSYYIWELSADADFTQPIATREVTAAEFNSGLQGNINEDITYYWRVKAVKPNALIATSAVHSFSGSKFRIISPADGAENISLSPYFEWTDIGEGANYTLEISTKSDFGTMAYTVTQQTTQVTVPEGTLATATTYYARVRASLGSIQAISERIRFVTEEQDIPVPVITSPENEATVYGKNLEICWQTQFSKGFRAEISQDNTFPTRNTKVKATEWNEYCAMFENLPAGTWYARVKANNVTGQTDPSAIITVYLNGGTGVEAVEATDICYSYYDGAGNCFVVINSAGNASASVEIYSTTGMLLSRQAYRLDAGKTTLQPDMTNYAKGIYLIRVTVEGKEKTLKVRR